VLLPDEAAATPADFIRQMSTVIWVVYHFETLLILKELDEFLPQGRKEEVEPFLTRPLISSTTAAAH
jgi:hypothetical protein